MGMNAGNLDRRVQFLRAGTTDDGFGGVQSNWQSIGSLVAAARRDVSDAERFAAAKISAHLMTRFRVRSNAFSRGVLHSDRLTCDGLEFEIVGIKEIEGRQSFLEFTCIAEPL